MHETTTFINLCPHEIRIRRVHPQKDLILPPADQPARCEEITEHAGVIDGLQCAYTTYGQVQNLPDPQPNIIYVVSNLVRQSLPYRVDLASPGSPIRDAKNRVIVVKNLILNPSPLSWDAKLNIDIDQLQNNSHIEIHTVTSLENGELLTWHYALGFIPKYNFVNHAKQLLNLDLDPDHVFHLHAEFNGENREVYLSWTNDNPEDFPDNHTTPITIYAPHMKLPYWKQYFQKAGLL